ncbi:hypothetical protein NL352_28900, partial [Klebsiella pneumoniae]|nr:hypothetical protein [Klebsiella pneumoniae]
VDRDLFSLYTTRDTILILNSDEIINEFDPSQLLEKQYLDVFVYDVSDIKVTITQGQVGVFWYVLDRVAAKLEMIGAWCDLNQTHAPW